MSTWQKNTHDCDHAMPYHCSWQCLHGPACWDEGILLWPRTYLITGCQCSKGYDVCREGTCRAHKSQPLQSGRSSKLGSESVISAISYTLCSGICLTTEQSIVRYSVLQLVTDHRGGRAHIHNIAFYLYTTVTVASHSSVSSAWQTLTQTHWTCNITCICANVPHWTTVVQNVTGDSVANRWARSALR